MSVLPRKDDGSLWAFTEFGSYPLVYQTRAGTILCPDCANEKDRDEDYPEDKPVSCAPRFEGQPIGCDSCSAVIESAYGDPSGSDQ